MASDGKSKNVKGNYVELRGDMGQFETSLIGPAPDPLSQPRGGGRTEHGSGKKKARSPKPDPSSYSEEKFEQSDLPCYNGIGGGGDTAEEPKGGTLERIGSKLSGLFRGKDSTTAGGSSSGGYTKSSGDTINSHHATATTSSAKTFDQQRRSEKWLSQITDQDEWEAAHSRIFSFYRLHNPDEVFKADKAMTYDITESELMLMLREKYKVKGSSGGGSLARVGSSSSKAFKEFFSKDAIEGRRAAIKGGASKVGSFLRESVHAAGDSIGKLVDKAKEKASTVSISGGQSGTKGGGYELQKEEPDAHRDDWLPSGPHQSHHSGGFSSSYPSTVGDGGHTYSDSTLELGGTTPVFTTSSTGASSSAAAAAVRDENWDDL